MASSEEDNRIRRIDAAFRLGDLSALRAELDSSELVPNGPMPQAIGPCLEYAIYHSPLSFVRELLEIGADPNPLDHAGFPPLIAALWGNTRPDWEELLELLLSFGADPNQRGHNDYTALHVAVLEENRRSVEILLAAGADASLRTRIDDYETPIDLAENSGYKELLDLLRARVEG